LQIHRAVEVVVLAAIHDITAPFLAIPTVDDSFLHKKSRFKALLLFAWWGTS
jgi:hypothetical protein